MATKKGDKVKSGLKHVHYAVISEDENGVVSYETPVKMPGAVNVSLSALFEQTNIPADDDPSYATIEENNGYEGELEILILPDQFKIDVLGYTLDENDVLVENKDAVSKPFALMFEFSGDKNKMRHLLYRCKATKPNIESGTKGDSAEAKTDTLPFKATPAHDTGDIKAKAMQGDPAYDGWYQKVYTGTTQTAQTAQTASDTEEE